MGEWRREIHRWNSPSYDRERERGDRKREIRRKGGPRCKVYAAEWVEQMQVSIWLFKPWAVG